MLGQLDLTVMPLGKLSMDQIEKGLNILSQLHNYLIEYGEGIYDKFVKSYTHQFFMTIPHNCGIYNPPRLNDLDLIGVRYVAHY